jgi:hypothetical protein
MGMGTQIPAGQNVQTLINQFGGGRMSPQGMLQEATLVRRIVATKQHDDLNSFNWHIGDLDHLLQATVLTAIKMVRLLESAGTPSRDREESEHEMDGLLKVAIQIVQVIQARYRILPEIIQQIERLKRLHAGFPRTSTPSDHWGLAEEGLVRKTTQGRELT